MTPQTIKLHVIIHQQLNNVSNMTERDFCIISDCRNSFNNEIKNLRRSQKIYLTQHIHRLP